MPHPHDHHSGHVDLITESARDALHVRRAFGEPVVQGDVTIIPVARVRGGNGVGFGSGAMETGGEAADTPDGSEHAGNGGHGDGGGGGFGVAVRPLGVFVVSGGDARWRPTIDVNRVVLGGQVVGVVAVLAGAHLLRHVATLRARTAVATSPSAPLLRSALLTVPRVPHLRVPRLHLARRMTIGTVGLVADAVRRARR